MLSEYQQRVTAADIPPEKLGEIIDQLLDIVGLVIIEEATPDYVSYELKPKESV